MGTDNLIFLEILELFDQTGRELVHRIPEGGWGDQARRAVDGAREPGGRDVYQAGHDAFGPGRHTLVTGNIPILTRLLSAPWGMKSPLRAKSISSASRTSRTSRGARATRWRSRTRGWADPA